MTKVALTNKSGGYGTRVFIDTNEHHSSEFMAYMDDISAWNGADWRDDDGHIAWELPLAFIAPVFGEILKKKFDVTVIPPSEMLR